MDGIVYNNNKRKAYQIGYRLYRHGQQPGTGAPTMGNIHIVIFITSLK